MAQSVSGQYQGYESVSRISLSRFPARSGALIGHCSISIRTVSTGEVTRTGSSKQYHTVSSNKNWDVATVVIRVPASE